MRQAALVALGGFLVLGAPAQARTIAVPWTLPTIQAAVDAAAPGDTVIVGKGTFTEEVVIDKDLTLRGAGVGATTITAPATLTSYGVHLTDGRALTAIVRVGRGAHVRMSGLTVSGPIPCGIEVSGINALQGATLELSDARVTAIRPDAATCPPGNEAGRAVVYGTPPHVLVDGEHGTTAYGRITRVAVDRYQHAGISVTGPRGGALSRVTVADDVVTGGWEILVQSAVPGTMIAANEIAANDVGVYQVDTPGCCGIAGNTLDHNRWFGIVIQDGDGATSGNTITGGQVGVGVVADAVDTTGILRGDQITAATIASVREIQCCGYTATAIVK